MVPGSCCGEYEQRLVEVTEELETGIGGGVSLMCNSIICLQKQRSKETGRDGCFTCAALYPFVQNMYGINVWQKELHRSVFRLFFANLSPSIREDTQDGHTRTQTHTI